MVDKNKFVRKENWHKALIPVDSTLQHAISNLNETALQIALVVTSDNRLLGTITDGDIRRSLLNNFSMNKTIEDIVHKDPLVVPPTIGRDMVLQIMQANQIRQVPVVNDDRKVVGLHLWDEIIIPDQRSNLVVIMAGGQGKRLRPHTENCPKPLLPVGEKPMLEHTLERAKADGFSHFVLAIQYLGHMIEEYFGNGGKWQVQIDYLQETVPLGTAGAIGMLNPKPESPFIVANGDVLTDISYAELLDFHCRHNATATMAVRLHEWQNPFGVIRTKGIDIIGFEEKPVSRSHVNAGVYVLEPKALESLRENENCDMPELFSRLQEKGERTIVFPMHEPWLDIGRADDLERAQEGHHKKISIKDTPWK